MLRISKFICAVALLFQLSTARELLDASVLPSLSLHVRVLRPTMRMHDTSEFDVIATPFVSTDLTGNKTIAFDAMTGFRDGANAHQYVIVNGLGYHTIQDSAGNNVVSCISPASLPPIHDILRALDTAKAVTVDSSKIDCPTKKTLAAKLGSQSFIVCAATDAGYHIYGSNFDATVKFMLARTEIPKPSISDAEAQKCKSIVNSAVVSSSTLGLLTHAGADYFNRSSTDARLMSSLKDSSCTCKGARRPCLFIHGMGKKEDGGLVDSLSYFGSIADHAPCCSSIKFTQINTVDNNWYSSAIQQRICDYTLSRSPSSNTQTRVIADTIIVTHSMGSLMVGSALASGKCSIGKNVDWVSLSGPMKGSMGADFLQDACTSNGSTMINLVGKLAGIIGQCPASTAILSLFYQGEKYCSPNLNSQFNAAQQTFLRYVTAAMCSNDYDGIMSTDQAVLQLAGSAIPHKSPQNDGVVEFQSCRGGIAESKFSSSYSNTRYYVTELNHLDTAFRHGDGWFNEAKMPVKWFECLL